MRRPESTVNRVIMWSKSKGNLNQKQVHPLERKPLPSPAPSKGENGLPLPSPVKLNQKIISTLVDLLRVNVNIFFNEMIHAAYKDRASSGHPGTRVPGIASGSVDDKSLDVKGGEETIDRVIQVTPGIEAGETKETIERRSVTDERNSNNSESNVTSVNGNSMSQVASETIGIGKGDIPQSVGKPSGLEPPRFDKPNQMIHNSISLVTSTTSIGSGSNGYLSDQLSQ